MSRITLPDQYCAPAPTEEHALLVVHSPLVRLLGERFSLSRQVVIGRDPGCELALDVPDVSRRHACIHEQHGRHFVEDLGSTNGTFVDERRITSWELAPSSLLRVGSVVLKCLPRSDLEALCSARLKQLADEDTLTGLALRRVFSDALSREFARSRRHGHPLCLALLDIDGFKGVNDRLGHDLRYSLTWRPLAAKGWRPTVPFTDGMRETVEWYRDRQDWARERLEGARGWGTP